MRHHYHQTLFQLLLLHCRLTILYRMELNPTDYRVRHYLVIGRQTVKLDCYVNIQLYLLDKLGVFIPKRYCMTMYTNFHKTVSVI